MRCPKCSSEESKVVDSRQAEDAIRRRRVCESCSQPLNVSKKCPF